MSLIEALLRLGFDKFIRFCGLNLFGGEPNLNKCYPLNPVALPVVIGGVLILRMMPNH